MNKLIVKTATLNTTPDISFRMFTENKLLENWLTVKADVEAVEGGKYELFWTPGDPTNNSTIGCRVLAIEKPFYLKFEWKGPVQFKDFMNNANSLTNVTVFFNQHENCTKATLIHKGWINTPEWEKAREYFISAWDQAFNELETHVKHFT